jgi:glycosyltransferase involved in cell wall biosynthesis
MRAAVIVPAYQAEALVGQVIEQLVELWPERNAVFAVDDGSSDRTSEVAREAGAEVLRHPRNRGKGAALRTGLRMVHDRGFDVAITVDADGQHPPSEALRLHRSCDDPQALVIGVRDLVGAGAPRANQLSNRFSNLVLSGFTGCWLSDTQCGLRRYPVAATLALGGREDGYGYEAEILLRACLTPMPIIQRPIRVIYPPEEERLSHFDSVRDPTRIVMRVMQTVASTRARWLAGKAGLAR